MPQYWGTGRLGTHQSAAYTGTPGNTATAVGNGVQKVRVVVTSAAYVKIGQTAIASSNDVYMPIDTPEYFTVNPGERVSAVQVSSGGTLHVTELP